MTWNHLVIQDLGLNILEYQKQTRLIDSNYHPYKDGSNVPILPHYHPPVSLLDEYNGFWYLSFFLILLANYEQSKMEPFKIILLYWSFSYGVIVPAGSLRIIGIIYSM